MPLWQRLYREWINEKWHKRKAPAVCWKRVLSQPNAGSINPAGQIFAENFCGNDKPVQGNLVWKDSE
jgi:hypothetical protein